MSMPTVRFGRTGLIVSRLALGTMTFGLQTEEPVAREILGKAASAGVNFLDTADVYPLGGGLPLVGRTEEIVGRWLKGQRASYILATKAVGRMGPNPWDQGASRKHLLDAIDASLGRLQTDYVDLYQLHSDDPVTPLDETLEALDTIVKSGRARYVGVSILRLSHRIGLGPLGAQGLGGHRLEVQPPLQPALRRDRAQLLPAGARGRSGGHSLQSVGRRVADGQVQVRLRADARHALHTTLGGRKYPGPLLERARLFDSPGAPQRLAGKARGSSLTTTLAVAWTLANPAITAPLLEAAVPEQLDDQLAAATCTISLEPALKDKLDALTAEYRRGDAPR